MTPKSEFNKIMAEKVIKAMETRNIHGFYCETKKEALKKALEIIPENSSIAWGGSESISEIGLLESLSKGKYTLYDRSAAKTLEEKNELILKAFSSDYYLMSTNAFTSDGKLVNIDGTGNRVAAMIYGPKNVIIIAGMNKLEPDEASALKRARNKAAAINAIRLSRETPCVKSASCHNCTSPDCICCHTVITRMSKPKGRIKVILVGEELGF